MLKKLWEKMIAKFHAGEAKLDAETIAVLSEITSRFEAVEAYLASTPNHIGQVYTLPAERFEEAAPLEAEPVKDEAKPAVDAEQVKAE